MLQITANQCIPLCTGSVFNVYMGFWYTGLVYVLAIFMGGLGHSLMWPFKGLIGCSPGVYGLIGACWVLLVFHRARLGGPVLFVLPVALAAHLIGDSVMYLYYYSGSVGYASHFFGYITGITVALSLLLLEFRSDSPLRLCTRKVCGFIGLISFALIATYLITHYASGDYPSAVERGFLHNSGTDESTCCAQLFSYASEQGVSVHEAKKESYCVHDQLYQYHR
jgi:hypothetical protein